MENFSTIKKRLNSETKKYLNIQVILSRLENKNHLEKIYSLLKEMKQAEDQFTINGIFLKINIHRIKKNIRK